MDIPAFPEATFREAILNALIHRDYLEAGSVYLRHMDREMSISSPGGFIGVITAENVLHAEPKARNRQLAEIFQKLGLIERAGIGRRRIFIPPLAYGKRTPLYEADDHTVKLTLFDGIFDRELVTFITTRERKGESFDIIELLLLAYLKKQFDDKKVEPNSSLGQAINYMLKQWEELTLFLRVEKAPLDNNICERALKMAILHRKNSLFYKTEHGAYVGDLFMSLIHTCNLSKTNPLDSLTELQKNTSSVFKNPRQWLPWNYQKTLCRQLVKQEHTGHTPLSQTISRQLQAKLGRLAENTRLMHGACTPR